MRRRLRRAGAWVDRQASVLARFRDEHLGPDDLPPFCLTDARG